MEIKVIGETIALSKDETLVEKTNRNYSVSFLFDSLWTGLTKTAYFRAGSTLVYRELVDNKCVIPAECLQTGGVILYILVRGSIDDVTIQTPWCLTSRILYDISPGNSTPGTTPGTVFTGEKGRLVEEFSTMLGDYTEEELEEMSLNDILDEVADITNNTATDDEVGEVLNDVWGSVDVAEP